MASKKRTWACCAQARILSFLSLEHGQSKNDYLPTRAPFESQNNTMTRLVCTWDEAKPNRFTVVTVVPHELIPLMAVCKFLHCWEEQELAKCPILDNLQPLENAGLIASIKSLLRN